MRGRVLIIAGSDSGGGAGLQADVKTVTVLGGFAMTAVTALTAQNTKGVYGVHPVPAPFVEAQMRVVLEDLGADVVKIGMLGSVEIARTVARVLREVAAHVPVVLDPVLVATSGDALSERGMVDALWEHLLPLASLVTPNLPEAEALLGGSISDDEGLARAGAELVARGARAALVKGGHLGGDTVTDHYVDHAGTTERLSASRIPSRSTHGTGCTLASAIATGLAAERPLLDAIRHARGYVRRAIELSPGLGGGHGPLNHAWPLVTQSS
jgi:hydroxymethylpyrimidine/phosphomethylpyrimidine kinase